MARPKRDRLPPGLMVRNGNFWVDLTVNGNRIRHSLKTRDRQLALEKLRDILRADHRGKKTRLAVGTLLTNWLCLKIGTTRPSTSKRYAQHVATLERLLPQGIRVDHLNESVVIAFRQARLAENGEIIGQGQKHRVSAATIAKDEMALQMALRWAVESGDIQSNPIAKMKPPEHHAEEYRALTAEECRRLLAAANEPWKSLWETLLLTGMRRGELAGLKWSSIDWDRRLIVLRPTATKGKKRRELPINDRLLAILRARQVAAQDRQSGKDLVFASGDDRKCDVNLSRQFAACCHRAEIQKATPEGIVNIHSLRRTFASELLRRGANPRVVQALLGHSTVGLTMRLYAKFSGDDARHAADLLAY